MTPQTQDPYQDLLNDLVRSIVIGTGTRETIAREYAVAAMQCLQQRKAANGTVYVPAPPRRWDVLQIEAALRRGETVKRVCTRFGISRRALYELFDGRLPKAESDAA